MRVNLIHTHFFYLLLCLIFVTHLLAGCTPPELDVETETALAPSKTVAKLEPTPTFWVCTDLACSNSISVILNGPPLTEYIVEHTDEAQNKTIVHCLSNTEPNSITTQKIPLNTPEISNVLDISPIPKMCGEDQEGTALIWPPFEGFAPEHVVVQCSESNLTPYWDLIFGVTCINTEGKTGISFGYYGENRPETLPLTIYWDVYSTTVQLKPDYSNYNSSWRPNGPKCEPLCISNIMTVDLP